MLGRVMVIRLGTPIRQRAAFFLDSSSQMASGRGVRPAPTRNQHPGPGAPGRVGRGSPPSGFEIRDLGFGGFEGFEVWEGI